MRLFENSGMYVLNSNRLVVQIRPEGATTAITDQEESTIWLPNDRRMEFFLLRNKRQFIVVRNWNGRNEEGVSGWVGGIDGDDALFYFQAGHWLLWHFLANPERFLEQRDLLELTKPSAIRELEKQGTCKVIRFGSLFCVPQAEWSHGQINKTATLWPYRITGRIMYLQTPRVILAEGTIKGKEDDDSITLCGPHAIARSDELLPVSV